MEFEFIWNAVSQLWAIQHYYQSLIILYHSRINIMAPKNIAKNSACISCGLFLISLSALLMIQIYYQNQTTSQIQNTSILKDIRYPYWGKHPNPSQSQLTQTFTLFNLQQQDNEIKASKSNISKSYQYHFEYQNTSFSQGNSGSLNFINKWELKQIHANAPSSANIKTINLAADKVFNYDYYAPPQRKFPILFNYIIEALSSTFLQKFYTAYLFQFFFKHKDLVINTVFKPLGYDPAKASQIYQHSTFGWSNLETFKSWVVLSLKGSKSALKTEQYESLVMELGLTSKQIQSLAFEKSTLYNMISALNGTIKSKLMMSGKTNFNYRCPETSCTNSELVAFQIASSFLTNDPLFSSLNLNFSSKDLNSTFLADVEYQRFCDKNAGKFLCMSRTGMVKFFTHNYLGDFEKMNLLWQNKDKYDLIQKQFDLENNTGQSVVAYVFELYDKFIFKYENVFAWSQISYNSIQPTVMAYKNLFLVELYSRAYFNKFLANKEVECKDYFVGEFADLAQEICESSDEQNSSWNFVKYFSALQKFMQAYMYIGGMRETLSNTVKIPYEKLIGFFNNQNVSLFAKQLKQVEGIFKASFGCAQNSLSLCTSEQLFCMQWGSNEIFPKLPSDIFENKIKSITEWDTNKILNGLNPDFHAITGKTKTVQECMKILSSDNKQGIFSLFNILKMAGEAAANPASVDVLKYIGRNVMQVNFNGILNSQDVDSLFNGFKSQIINKKNQMNISSGGAPWLENEIKLVKTDNKIDIKNNELLLVPQFDTIDTGIYNQDKTRQISKIWGESTSSSKYTVYCGTKTDEDGKEIPVDIFKKYVTDRKVEGTNLFGFHPNIKNGENLQIFVNQAHQSMNLTFSSEISYEFRDQIENPINAYKYSITMRDDMGSFIGIEELNQNYFELSSQSYAVVEPITGLTLELSLAYTIKSSPLYTKFLLNSSDAQLPLYTSQLYYKRRGLTNIEQIIINNEAKATWSIISIVIGSISFAAMIALTVVYCKLSKRNDENSVSLLENESENPVDYVQ